MKIRYLLSVLLLSGCASKIESEMLKPSDLNSNPKLYEGKLVDVEGYLVTEIGVSSGLWDSKLDYQSDDEIDVCITLRNNEVLDTSLDTVNFNEVKLRGVFKADIITGIDLNVCNSSGLELVKIVK